MDPIPEKVDLAWILKNKDRIRDALRTVGQTTRLDYILSSGEVRRAQYAKKARNAVLDLRDITSGISTYVPPSTTNTILSNTWSDLAVANGGCVTQVAIRITSAVHAAIEATNFASKILMLYPFCGCNMISATVPLIDQLGKGLLLNTGFVDADFTQALGITGGLSKYLDTQTKPFDLNGVVRGGLGWWENNISSGLAGTYSEPMGSNKFSTIPDNRFSLDLRSTGYAFNWGTVGSGAALATTPVNGHYYGQSAGPNLRQIYFGGVLSGANTSSTDSVSDRNIILMGDDNGYSGIKNWSGRGFLAYLTDGTLSAAEVAEFHSILTTYLVNPKITGVPVPFVTGGPPGNDTFPNPDDPENTEATGCEACINQILVSRTGEILASQEGNVLQTRAT